MWGHPIGEHILKTGRKLTIKARVSRKRPLQQAFDVQDHTPPNMDIIMEFLEDVCDVTIGIYTHPSS
jgi:hypothetical protein